MQTCGCKYLFCGQHIVALFNPDDPDHCIPDPAN